ncbi:biofilm peroxide resistance protein BsmA [Shimwellia pseudoproteus]|uniref:biofilm peroxide resistance protein BsmA n=1 Tax=Shimwellia pseudoproteus TaxID=570012 RepID=UPI001E408559|nr:biofilm peroxide resistance protein BsmA [Shimwellia pseudoproteus]
MKRWVPMAVAVILTTGCSVLQVTPTPPPPVASYPQEIQRAQTSGLQRLGSVSAMVRGSPMDGEAAIKAKAARAGADYYMIIMNDDTTLPGQWYIQAILYRR